MPEDLREKLDDLIKKLEKTFETCKEFKPDKYKKDHYYIWESHLDYLIYPLLMRGNRRCNWDNIQYICQNGHYRIYPGEQDGYGWINGIIEKSYPNGLCKAIIYG